MNRPSRHFAPSTSHEPERGRHADRPQQIPKAGWWDILSRVRKAIGRDNVSLVAAGLAMYALLAVFPTLAAAVSIYGVFASPAKVFEHLQGFAGILPPGAWDVFSKQLQELADRPQGALTATAVGALVVALWSARAGMASLMTATNIAYSEQEKRGFIRQALVSLAFTAGAIIAFLTMLLLGIVVPMALKAMGVRGELEILVNIGRWALLWIVGVAGLAVIYRYGPARKRARWRWVTWGSVMAASVWLIATFLFSLYVRTFGTYGKTYGALSGVTALLMWLYLSSFILVLGAELNAEMERQTAEDTTDGPEKPPGQRGAHAADTVGPSSGGS
jgi:membrane protein